MTKSKLVQLLRTFTKDEFRRFGKFVRSPFFHKDKAVIRLYDSLKPFHPDLNDEGLTKKLLFEKMYPKKLYSDSQMKYLMSEMFGMGKQFLAFVNYERDSIGQDIRLLKELNSRNTAKIFESELDNIEERVDSYKIRNEEYFHNMYKMKELVSDFYSYKDRLSKKREHSKVIENIINGFLISLLDIYYELSNDAIMFGVNIDLGFLIYIEDLIINKSAMIDPAVHIYYNIFMLTHRKEEIYYLKLLDLKNTYLHSLDDSGKHRIFEALGNHCINNYQLGGIKYYREAFNLINDEIKNGIRFSRKEFSEIFFTNKVEIASKIKEFRWAYYFIDKYKERLNSQNRNDIVNFCYAIIEFESGNYPASLDLLAKINLHHPLLRFRIRNYTLLNYYELNYFEQAFSLVDSYKHMLAKDKKMKTSWKERYNAFLSLYQKLLETKFGSKKIDKDFVRKEIESKSAFMKEWLLEKVNQL